MMEKGFLALIGKNFVYSIMAGFGKGKRSSSASYTSIIMFPIELVISLVVISFLGFFEVLGVSGVWVSSVFALYWVSMLVL